MVAERKKARAESRCTRCGETKPAGEFHRRRNGPHGLAYWCKACCAAYQARYAETKEGRQARREAAQRYDAKPEARRRKRERERERRRKAREEA